MGSMLRIVDFCDKLSIVYCELLAQNGVITASDIDKALDSPQPALLQSSRSWCPRLHS